MRRFPLIMAIFCFSLASCSLWAQDERYFRQIFTGELGKERKHLRTDYKWEVEGPAYKIDLDGDGIDEGITISKKDGEDWIQLSGKLGHPFYSAKIQAKGVDSALFRINLVSLSEKVKVLLLSFYEGYTKYLQFNGTARLCLLSFENNNLKEITFEEGPSFWLEREKIVNQYFKRLYQIETLDLNKDDQKEIIVSFNHSKRVLAYVGRGKFQQPGDR